ncbi:hypothetical protein LEMLEM_LOCUS12859 [Lemmus lemmus]
MWTPALTTACAMRPQAHWAPRAVSATRPQRAWMAVSSCAVAAAMTASRAFRWSVAIAGSTGVALSGAKNALRSWTSMSVNDGTHASSPLLSASQKSILYKSI